MAQSTYIFFDSLKNIVGGVRVSRARCLPLSVSIIYRTDDLSIWKTLNSFELFQPWKFSGLKLKKKLTPKFSKLSNLDLTLRYLKEKLYTNEMNLVVIVD